MSNRLLTTLTFAFRVISFVHAPTPYDRFLYQCLSLYHLEFRPYCDHGGSRVCRHNSNSIHGDHYATFVPTRLLSKQLEGRD